MPRTASQATAHCHSTDAPARSDSVKRDLRLVGQTRFVKSLVLRRCRQIWDAHFTFERPRQLEQRPSSSTAIRSLAVVDCCHADLGLPSEILWAASPRTTGNRALGTMKLQLCRMPDATHSGTASMSRRACRVGSRRIDKACELGRCGRAARRARFPRSPTTMGLACASYAAIFGESLGTWARQNRQKIQQARVQFDAAQARRAKLEGR
jgi:hypothetical protein